MNTYDLAYQILANGYLPDNHPQYPLAPASAIPYQLYRELNDCMTQNFERMVVNARSGYWLQSQRVNTVAGRSDYRVPHRMCAGGLERVEIARSGTSEFVPLQEESGTEAVGYELANNGRGKPLRYEMRGDRIALLPTPDSSNYVLRVWYYLQPSRMVTPQSLGYGAPGYTKTLRGYINHVNPTTRVVGTNGLPNDMLASPGGVPITVDSRVDIVRSYGWHEVIVLDAPIVDININQITLGGEQPLDDVSGFFTDSGGDYVRVAGQTDWPAIPDDFHRTVADLASVSVLNQLSLHEKANQLLQKVAGDLQRFKELLQPRVKNQARLVPMAVPGMYARGPQYRGGFSGP